MMMKSNSNLPQKMMKKCGKKCKMECECEGKEKEMLVGGVGKAKEPKKVIKKGKR